jgi:hypothetical protein
MIFATAKNADARGEVIWKFREEKGGALDES